MGLEGNKFRIQSMVKVVWIRRRQVQDTMVRVVWIRRKQVQDAKVGVV